MSVVLQPLDVSFEEPAEPEPAAEVAEAVETPEAPEHPPEPLAKPEPKRRGRPPNVKTAGLGLPQIPKAKPKAKPKPKAPPPPQREESDSSDVDETLRSVYNHVAKPSMETAILEFLVNRKQGETQKRRQLWSQLAQM